MTTLPLLVVLLPLQSLPQDAVPAVVPTRLDQVELQGGEVLEGRILLESAGYLEIELEPGAVVGFRTSAVAAVRRGAGADRPDPQRAPLPPRDDWFSLHDASGRPVGWLHSTVVADSVGGATLQEEWEFTDGARTFAVTLLESVAADLRPKSVYFRERVHEQIDGQSPIGPLAQRARTVDERIVEASVHDGELVVRRLHRDGRSERRLPWSADALSPLLARELSARSPAFGVARDGVRTVTVFDAASEELVQHRYLAPQPRIVPGDGASSRIDETIEHSGAIQNAVWRDAQARVVRREVAGPGLVAVPCRRHELPAAAATAAAATALPAAFVAEAEQRFGLWRPNPVWSEHTSRAGAVNFASEVHRASVTLSLLPDLGAGATIDTATESALRWLLLLLPELRVEQRQWVRVRERTAARIDLVSDTARVRTVLHVVPAEAGFVALRCSAPAAAWDELAADFAACAARLELVPAIVRGLAADTSGPGKSPAAVPAAPAPDRASPRVRLPVEAAIER